MANSPIDLPYLPDDLLLNCLARVSRLYYPILSLVSKRFRSLVASLDLYEIRTLLGRTENCLYLSLRFSSKSDTRLWFTLCQRPTRTPNPNPNPNSRWLASCFRPHRSILMKKDKKSSENLMVSIPTRNFTCPYELTRTAVGSNIYMIDVLSNDAFSSRIYFMDCRSHNLHKVSSLQTPQKKPFIEVLDGKIYLVEGCKDPDYSNLVVCFDPKTQRLEHVTSPSAVIRGSYISRTLVFDGKLYMFGDKNLVYKPKENTWDVVRFELPLSWIPSNFSCVVGNVIYSYGLSRVLLWYDSESEIRAWRFLKGLKKLPKLPKHYRHVRLVNNGGKIAVLWEKNARGTDPKKMIWCAEITLERRNNGQEMYGKIEWCDVVLTVPKSCSLLHLMAVTV